MSGTHHDLVNHNHSQAWKLRSFWESYPNPTPIIPLTAPLSAMLPTASAEANAAWTSLKDSFEEADWRDHWVNCLTGGPRDGKELGSYFVYIIYCQDLARSWHDRSTLELLPCLTSFETYWHSHVSSPKPQFLYWTWLKNGHGPTTAIWKPSMFAGH